MSLGWEIVLATGLVVLLFGLVFYRWISGGFRPKVTKRTQTLEYSKDNDSGPPEPVTRTISTESEAPKSVLDWAVTLLAPVAAATVAVVGLLGAQQEILRAQDARVQEYLDTASTVLLNDQSSNSPGDQTESTVSAYLTGRTLTTLQGLDAERKGMIMQFVQQSQLINKDRPIVDLDGADLSEADMSNMDLSGTDLSGSLLTNANLSNSKLTGADLRGTNLTDANLSSAKGVTREQLEQQAASLEGATLPDGSTYN